MTQPALAPGSVAVITGGASGIGLAAAKHFARMGLRVCIADLDDAGDAAGDDAGNGAVDDARGSGRLARAAEALAGVSPGGAASIMAMAADVSRAGDLQHLEAAVRERFGGADILMNNAGVQPGSALFGPAGAWERVIGTNLWGVVHGTRAFAPGMVARGRPGLIINTGSKQGITTPPGDPAYNVSKAGVKAFTEALQHELRTTPGCRVSAHLLIPGFVFTPLTARGRVAKPDAAWTPEQTVDFMVERLTAGDFYILCPDGDVSRALDERRILWAAGDIVENRPPLSRWHPDHAKAAKAFLEGEG